MTNRAIPIAALTAGDSGGDSGCGCEVIAPKPRMGLPAACLLAAAALLRRRRD